MKILTVIGTRPEAIKMAPVISILNDNNNFDHRLCSTGQHKEMLDQILSFFEIQADYNLDVMVPNQTLTETHAKVMIKMDEVIQDFKPDMILVHGDTLTSFCGALIGYHNRIRVGHVEAGLRTGNMMSPWPEEGNRSLTARLATEHFAPTMEAKNNLIKENIPEDNIHVIGNTVIDSILQVKAKIDNNDYIRIELQKKFEFLGDAKLILVTGHRRENFGQGIQNICLALKKIAIKNPAIHIIYPVHLNPKIKKPVMDLLDNLLNIHLLPPLDYLDFTFLMMRSHLILTDSGGIQEEAPSLKKPVLLMRDETERPEAVAAGTVRLVGNKVDNIIKNVQILLDDDEEYKQFSLAENPYGDGKSSQKIIELIQKKYI